MENVKYQKLQQNCNRFFQIVKNFFKVNKMLFIENKKYFFAPSVENTEIKAFIVFFYNDRWKKVKWMKKNTKNILTNKKIRVQWNKDHSY